MAETDDSFPILDVPVERSRASAWRTAVLDLRYGERRRVFPTTVHVGEPGGPTSSFELPAHHRRDRPEPFDQALRTDLVAAMVDRRAGPATAPAVWLTRSGPLGRHDEDMAWHSAARTAYQEAGMDLMIAVVTHVGWYDPRTGAGRRWKRLRRQ